MKKSLLLLLLVCMIASTALVSAQSSVTVEVSQLYTSFRFNDSQSNNLNTEYKGIFTGGYGVGYRYVTNFGLIVKPGFGIHKSGADLIYDDMNYSWRLQYADAKLGIGYIYALDRISPYFVASGYFSYLLNGTQVLNNEHFNIIESELLDNLDYGIVLTPGVEIGLTKNIASFLEFNYLMGLNNLEPDDSQTSTNFAYSLTVGFAFTF